LLLSLRLFGSRLLLHRFFLFPPLPWFWSWLWLISSARPA
jgi:hypothetical protein